MQIGNPHPPIQWIKVKVLATSDDFFSITVLDIVEEHLYDYKMLTKYLISLNKYKKLSTVLAKAISSKKKGIKWDEDIQSVAGSKDEQELETAIPNLSLNDDFYVMPSSVKCVDNPNC